ATIAYEMLSGQRPYDEGSSSAYMYVRLEATPTPITVHMPGLPQQAELVLQRALAQDPQDRYPRVTDFTRELGDALLPDRQRSHSIIVSDPAQAAQIRIIRQAITGFLWGMAVVAVIVMLFSTALFLRGSAAGSSSL